MPGPESEDGMNKVNWLEYEIQLCMRRINSLEKMFESGDISASKQGICQRELEEIRKLLDTHQKQLQILRSRNKWFKVASLLFFVFLGAYLLYVLVYPKNLRYSLNY